TCELIPAAGKFADGAPFFELYEHFQQGAVVGFLEMEAPADIVNGHRICSNLQKTKDVIGTQARWASHRLGPAGEGRQARRILLTFFWGTRNFFRGKWVTYAGQHTTGCPPSVRAVGHSPKRARVRRGDVARLSFLFPDLFSAISPALAGSRYSPVPIRTTVCNAG